MIINIIMIVIVMIDSYMMNIINFIAFSNVVIEVTSTFITVDDWNNVDI